MEQKINNLFRNVVSAVFMALVNFFVYFGFANQYSSTSFSLDSFQAQYNSGIYQFRFLSTRAILWLYEWLKNFNFEQIPGHFLDQNADVHLYLALFLYNTLFAVLTVLVIGTYFNKQNIRRELKVAFPLLLALMIGLSEFVIVPYDTFAYFILVVFFCVLINYLKQNDRTVSLLILCLLMIIGTLNRETMALALALTASVLLVEWNVSKDSILPLSLLTVIFVATYFVLRVVFHTGTTTDGLLLGQNFSSAKNLLALLFIVLMLIIPLMLSQTPEQRKLILVFYFFSLPYILFCLFVGILFEIRLFVPLFIPAVMLSQCTFNKNHLR